MVDLTVGYLAKAVAPTIIADSLISEAAGAISVASPLHVYGDVSLHGASSGTLALRAPTIAGTSVITFPVGTTNFTVTGGTGQVLRQSTAGGAITVAALAAAEISGLAPIASSGSAADLTAGIVPSARVSGAYTGITSVGTLTAGIWNASTVGLAYGGTQANLTSTGGPGQVLRQSTLGGAVSVAALAAADVTGLAPIASSGSASDLSAGTVPAARIAGSYTGITGVGTLTAGTWTAGVVGVAYGGTGANLNATGGTGQVLRQSTAGGPITVSALTAADVGVSGVYLPLAGGQLSGALGILAAPIAALSTGGTYTTANQQLVYLGGTLASSATSQFGLNFAPLYAPTGASLSQLISASFTSTLNSTAFALTSFYGIFLDAAFGAGFTGTVTTTKGIHVADITGSVPGQLGNVHMFATANLSNGNGLTTGTVGNISYLCSPITASSAGGTLNNTGMLMYVPQGGASAGTAVNRGLHITGAGGASTGGTVTNHAIYNDSAANVFLSAGNVGMGSGANATTPGRQFVVAGANQAVGNITDTGNTGGQIFLYDTAGAAANGGSVLFGASNSTNANYPIAAIKALMTNGTGPTGDLIIATRNAGTDTNLTERVRFYAGGNVGFGVNPGNSAQVVISGVNQLTGSFDTTGAMGGTLQLNDGGGTSIGAGGAIVFSQANTRRFALIKGFLQSATANSSGDIVFSTRPNTADATLTEGVRMSYLGNLAIKSGSAAAAVANLVIGTTAAPGTARTYNLFTDGSNGEWAYLGSWASSVAQYGTSMNGTGVARDVSFQRGGVEQFRLTSLGPTTPGALLIGQATTALNVAGASNQLLQVAYASSQARLTLVRTSNDIGPPAIFFGKGRSGNMTGAGTVATGDQLMEMRFGSDDGSAAGTFPVINAYHRLDADGTVSTGIVPARFSWHTMGLAGGAPVERMRLSANGNLGLNHQADPQALLHVGRTAATARIYNTYTDASNSDWAYLGDWSKVANVATYGTDFNGTGAVRDVLFQRGGVEYFRLIGAGVRFTAGVVMVPAASVTPAANGQMMVEATSNTSLTFKLRGTDGIIRSGSITLA